MCVCRHHASSKQAVQSNDTYEQPKRDKTHKTLCMIVSGGRIKTRTAWGLLSTITHGHHNANTHTSKIALYTRQARKLVYSHPAPRVLRNKQTTSFSSAVHAILTESVAVQHTSHLSTAAGDTFLRYRTSSSTNTSSRSVTHTNMESTQPHTRR